MAKKRDPGFAKLVRDVETVGWHVILVREDEEGPAFGYTVGAFKTFGCPEGVLVGLRLEVTHAILNDVVEHAKTGDPLRLDEPYSQFLDGYEVVFRRVHPSHYDAYFGQAQRYYGNDDFPVIQCVYPDRKGRFPWDRGTSPDFVRQQPVLDYPFAFKDSRRVAVFTTKQVLDEGKPIVLVTHDAEDGAWQFLCDTEERRTSDARVVSLESIVKRDQTINEVADLPLGYRASRKRVGGRWKREQKEGAE